MFRVIVEVKHVKTEREARSFVGDILVSHAPRPPGANDSYWAEHTKCLRAYLAAIKLTPPLHKLETAAETLAKIRSTLVDICTSARADISGQSTQE